MSSSALPTLRVAAFPYAPPIGGIADQLLRAARDGVDLAVFPELSLACTARLARLRRAELESLSEPLSGPSIAIVAQAVEHTGVAAGVGWLERGDDGALYNSYVVCMPGGAKHRHRKVYAMENPHLRAGEGFDVFDTPWGVTMSVQIGADNYLPENARVAALKGASLLLAPHRSYPGAAGQALPLHDWFVRAMPARAGDNGMFAVLSDAHDDRKPAGPAGTALIADPSGMVIATGLGPHSPNATADVDPARALHSVAHRWLGARRPDLYSALTATETHEPGCARVTAREGGMQARAAQARGSIAVSFAVVGRKRSMS